MKVSGNSAVRNLFLFLWLKVENKVAVDVYIFLVPIGWAHIVRKAGKKFRKSCES